ncbi:hypothetical protein TNCV_2610911 [Trichonephila clavipes]|nr:hypothetical protein TNCV_2610911 [Trichonephila clavipes]
MPRRHCTFKNIHAFVGIRTQALGYSSQLRQPLYRMGDMGDFTNSEKADMHQVRYRRYGTAKSNSREALMMYQESFLSRSMPKHKIFQLLYQQLCENGSFITITDGRGRSRTARQTHLQEVISDHVDKTPVKSARTAENRLHVSQQTVWRV